MLRSVDQAIYGAISRGVFPGAVISVMHGGEFVFHNAYGFTDPAGVQSTDDELIYDLASVTKPIFAMALLTLLEARAIPLDTTVCEFVDELSGSHHGSLTIRHLLVHTSGHPRRFTRLAEAEAALELNRDPEAVVSDTVRQQRTTRLLEDLRDVDLLFEPGSAVAYSSLGYFILGVIAERVSGTRLNTLVASTDVDHTRFPSLTYLPLHTHSKTRIAPTEVCPWRGVLSHGVVHDEVTGYVGGVAGHAGLFGTASDLAAFGDSVLRSSALGTISDSTLRDSTRSHTASLLGGSRGLGWQCWSEGSYMGERVSRDTFGHTGFTGTSLLVDPVDQLVVALLTNRVNPTRTRNRIVPVQRTVHDAISTEFRGA